MSLNGSKGEIAVGTNKTFEGSTFNVYDEGEYTPIGTREDTYRSTKQGDQMVYWDSENSRWYGDELLMNSELAVWPSSVDHSSCWMYGGKSFDVTGWGDQTADVTVNFHQRTELFNAGYATGSANGELIIRKQSGSDESRTDLWNFSLGSLGTGVTTIKESEESLLANYHFESGSTYEVLVKIKQSASAGFFGGSTIDQGVAGDGGYGDNVPAQAIAIHNIEIDWW